MSKDFKLNINNLQSFAQLKQQEILISMLMYLEQFLVHWQTLEEQVLSVSSVFFQKTLLLSNDFVLMLIMYH